MKYLWMLLALLLLGGLLATAQNEAEVTPELTPEATEILIDFLGLPIQPPMEISLPEGWDLLLRDTYLYNDIIANEDGSYLEDVPIDVYSGPLSNGVTGWIVMVWGFDSLVVSNGIEADFEERSMWFDGLRMLRLVVFEPSCNLGTGPQRSYTIGQVPAVGTTFSAVDCPNNWPDTRGWFASVKVDGLNFAFYAYADPLQPLESNFEYELQAILDTVVFKVDEVTITQAEFEATRDAYIQTLSAPTPTPSAP